MKSPLIFIAIALLAWAPLGLHSEPFTYESSAELSATLDADGDGLPDLVVVDKASGVRQLGIQQPDGSFVWAEPRSTGLDGVTALTAGWFMRDGSVEGFAVAAPTWNRVTVVPDPNNNADTYFNAMAPGLGPNLVVALDMAGDPSLDDLAIATCWDDPPSDSRLYAGVWNGITASNQYDLVAGQSGPLTHGNRAWLSNYSSLLVGMMRPTGATSEFLTRIPGTSGYDVGPAVTGLPPDTTWVWGVFDASGYSQFLFYAPGANTLYLRPVEENTPSVLSFGGGAAFDLGQPIQQVCVLPQTTGALLLIVLGDGSTAGLYDFDGVNAPVLRQTLTAPPGNVFSLAGALEDGNLLLLHGPAGGAGASTGWERWNLAGPQHLQTASGSLPTFTPSGGRANVLVYQQDVATNPDAEVQLMFQAGDWSVEADTIHAVLDVTAERFADPVSGLGSPSVTSFSRRPPGYYVPGLNEISANVNQRCAAASVTCLSPALGIPMGEIAFDPPSGVYPSTAAGGLTVRITATSDAPVHYRTDPSQPWTLYSAANPPSLSANTTLWAYADNPTGFWYYDYTDYSYHYADSGMYTPIRSATYRIAALPALEPAPQTDANGDGLGDAWAAAFGISDPLADADGDGANNRAEFAAGSDPFDPASVPPANDTLLATVDAAAVAAGRGLWDLSGSYTATVAGSPLVMTLAHDPTGRLTGTAHYFIGKALRVDMPVKGSVKGSSGSLTMNGSLAGADPAKTVHVALALHLTVDIANRQLLGQIAGSLRDSTQNTPVVANVTLPIPSPMDGTWTLQFQLEQVHRKIAGTALLTLSNGVHYAFAVQGRIRGAETLLTLDGAPANPAARAIGIRTTITPLDGGSARLERLSGRGYGQALLW
jgi:hypothetical protein